MGEAPLCEGCAGIATTVSGDLVDCTSVAEMDDSCAEVPAAVKRAAPSDAHIRLASVAEGAPSVVFPVPFPVPFVVTFAVAVVVAFVVAFATVSVPNNAALAEWVSSASPGSSSVVRSGDAEATGGCALGVGGPSFRSVIAEMVGLSPAGGMVETTEGWSGEHEIVESPLGAGGP